MFKRIAFVLTLFAALFQTAWSADRKFVLVIDAGHGGKDVGAPGTYSREKDINLAVALMFGKYVKSNDPDVKVVYTRTTDVFVPLYERAEIANKSKADLFISIHTNALSKGKTMRGFETYTLGDGRSQATKTNLEVAKRENSVILLEENYQQHYVGYDPNSPESNIMFEFVQDKHLAQSIELAKMMQRNVCSMASRIDRGVHQSNLAVLRLTSMPACLIELGYISTPDEERFLNETANRDRLARGIYNAFVEYKNKYFNGIVVPYKASAKPLPKVQDTVIDAAEKPDEEQKQSTKAVETPTNTASIKAVEAAEKDNTSSQKATHDAQTVANDTQKTVSGAGEQPIFKVQVFASSRKFAANDPAFKGLQGCESYEDGGLTKYTYGASTDYNEINKQRKQVAEKFPEAFIIAFKQGKRVDVNAAISEFKKNKQK